jgi:hypothetical protein
MIEITFPEGRIVSGHPMKGFTPTDDKTKLPKMKKDGITKVVEWSFGVAIPKAGTTDWRQTPWGAQVNQAAQDAVEGYTLAETQSKFFSWKIVDGDSTEPNRKGNKPCDQEGYPGHWVVFMSTQFAAPKCFHKDKYDPLQQIQNDAEIDKGDYVRVHCSVRGNKPSQTAGVYINPGMVSLERKGTAIVSANAGPSAASVFGAAPSAPAPVAAPAAPGVPVPPPATDLLVTPPAPPVEEKYNVNGAVYTKAQLLGFPGFTEEVIATLTRA